MFPRTICSVKFFEPIVSETLPFFGLETIALPPPPPPPPPVVSLSPPQAAIPRASARAINAATSARSRTFDFMKRFLLRSIAIVRSRNGLSGAQAGRGEKPLDAGQHELEGECHQRDEDRAGEDSLV